MQQLLEKQYPHNEKALKAFNEDKEGEEALSSNAILKDMEKRQIKIGVQMVIV